MFKIKENINNLTIMLKLELFQKLPDGKCISYEDIFSVFMVYDVRKFRECYLLIPQKEQEKLQEIIVVATEAGIRICYREGWPKGFVSKVKYIVGCKDQRIFQKIDYRKIPTDMQDSIADALIKHIQY